MQQQAVLAFGRRIHAQPLLPALLQEAAALVGKTLHAQFGGVGEVQGDELALTFTAQDARGRGVAPQEHRCPWPTPVPWRPLP